MQKLLRQMSKLQSYQKKKIYQKNHAYLFGEEKRQVYLQRPNLCPEVSDHIRIRFERTAQNCSRVFTNIPIRRVLDVSNQYFAYRNVKYAKYTVEREDGQMYNSEKKR